MSAHDELVRGWLRKADSDMLAVELALRAGVALDVACYHAQQAAEKWLKAYLIAYNIPFPFTHNLAKLLVLCQTMDAAFASLESLADLLTPYAVEARYDNEFWPSAEDVEEARDASRTIGQFVYQRLPPQVRPSAAPGSEQGV
jgi:HEPN domain-containing protein